MELRYSTQEIEAFAKLALKDGFCVLKNHFPLETISKWREACSPLLEQQIKLEGNATSRGAHRYYVTFPFVAPFSDPAVFENPDILAIIEKLVGRDFVMCQLASDTPVLGSDFQSIHRDCPALFPEAGIETPPYQLALNFPLVDVTSENGPLDIIKGTHLMTREEGLKQVDEGKAVIEPTWLKAGDVMIRDVRTLHRGTPNKTGIPRPMVVIGYSRSWLHRPEVSILIPRSSQASLSDFAKNMLRFNPVVDEIKAEIKPETYTNFLY